MTPAPEPEGVKDLKEKITPIPDKPLQLPDSKPEKQIRYAMLH